MAKLFGIPLRWKFILFMGDAPASVSATFLPTWVDQVYFGLGTPWRSLLGPQLPLIGGLFLFVLDVANSYDHRIDYCSLNHLLSIILGILLGTGLMLCLYHLLRGLAFSRNLLLLQGGLFLAPTCDWRCLNSLLFQPKFLTRTLIVGAGGAGRRLLEIIRKHSHRGLSPVGYIGDDPAKVGSQGKTCLFWAPRKTCPA